MAQRRPPTPHLRQEVVGSPQTWKDERVMGTETLLVEMTGQILNT